MKKTFTLSLLFCFAGIVAATCQTSIYGKITDRETAEELIGANVSIRKNSVLVTVAITDFEGNYSVKLDPDTYDVTVSYTGYDANRIAGVVVKAGQANRLNVQLGTGVVLDEIVVVEYKVPLIERDNTSCGGIVTSEEIAILPRKNIGALGSSTAGLKQSKTKRSKTGKSKAKKTKKRSSKNAANSIKGSRPNGTDVYVDGIRVNSTSKIKESKKPKQKIKKGPAAGQLTAGEWKDLDNWDFWDKLMKDKQFSKYKEFWGFHPDHRFELILTDEEGRPLANVTVKLLNATNEIVWSAMTDNKGSACLWGNFYGGDDSNFKFQIVTDNEEKTVTAIPYKNGLNSVELKAPCKSNTQVDIAFVVDVTGSMSDELEYLKSEVKDVINRAEEDEVNVDLRTAAVYYAGQHQTEVLKKSPLSDDSEKTIHFMHTSPRRGGEAYEAVDQGLGLAIRELDWNEDAMSRIIFLLLDANPSPVDDVKENMHNMIKEAAAKGIKVIPIAASGTDKHTEFLLKFFAMGTNSTYTFLTNHSGIGGHHIAPEAGSYNVETLNDLMVRLIIENSEYHTCDEEKVAPSKKLVEKNKLSKKAKRNKVNKTLAKQINCFPNPANDHVFVELEETVDYLVVTSSAGKTMERYPQINAGKIKLQTSDWPAGVYYLHFFKEEAHDIEKLVVVRE